MSTYLGITWDHCPLDPLLWLELREPLLQFLYQPWLVVPLVGVLSWLLTRPFADLLRSAVVVTSLLLASLLYSPIGTVCLSAWLQRQLPPSIEIDLRQGEPAVVVLLGRGPQVATATTQVAAGLFRSGAAVAVYVSGDAISTAQALVQLGVSSARLAGDSCARTTWENAIHTSDWLSRHYPVAPVLLITDPWQLPRATAAFRRQGLIVQAIPASPALSATQRNRLVLRETAGTLLYGLQNRL